LSIKNYQINIWCKFQVSTVTIYKNGIVGKTPIHYVLSEHKIQIVINRFQISGKAKTVESKKDLKKLRSQTLQFYLIQMSMLSIETVLRRTL